MSEPERGGSNQQLTTDVAAMEAAAGQLQDSRDILDGIIRRLGGVVGSVEASWRSDSSKAFTGVMERWTVNHNKLSNALDELAEGIRTGGRSYEAAEQQQVQGLSAVDPDAGGSVLSGSYE